MTNVTPENKSLQPAEDKSMASESEAKTPAGGKKPAKGNVTAVMTQHHKIDGKTYMPGDKVEMSEAEARYLKQHGYAQIL